MTWPDFVDYFEHVLDAELRLTPAAEQYRGELLRPRAWTPRAVPRAVVRGLQHERARELLDVPLRLGDQAAVGRFALRRKARVALRPSRHLTAEVRRTIAVAGRAPAADTAAGHCAEPGRANVPPGHDRGQVGQPD